MRDDLNLIKVKNKKHFQCQTALNCPLPV